MLKKNALSGVTTSRNILVKYLASSSFMIIVTLHAHNEINRQQTGELPSLSLPPPPQPRKYCFIFHANLGRQFTNVHKILIVLFSWKNKCLLTSKFTQLRLSRLGKNFTSIYFSYFSSLKSFDVSCKVFPADNLKKKITVNLLSAEFALRVVKINGWPQYSGNARHQKCFHM